MKNRLQLIATAKKVLYEACTPFGIVAATGGSENYGRIWARDSVIAGSVGVLLKDEKIIIALAKSVQTLWAAQGKNGQIPSNVGVSAEGKIETVSYGTLAPRLDSVCWWIMGAAWTADIIASPDLYLGVEKAINLLEIWEYNGRGLMYVPTGGNWADEYVTQGYNLYDQVLRAKALKLAGEKWQREDWLAKSKQIFAVLTHNYWGKNGVETSANSYHEALFDKKKDINLPYWLCSMSPTGYDTRFDLFGNALALDSEITSSSQAVQVFAYIQAIIQGQKTKLMPTFFPIIDEKNPEWKQLQSHYLYRFKNEPGAFHNGGIWLMTLGWLGLAAAKWGQKEMINDILNQLSEVLYIDNEYNMYEYINSLTGKVGGVKNLTFSAAGILMLNFSQIYTDETQISQII